jgi:alkylhydroperoxidase family enzyme
VSEEQLRDLSRHRESDAFSPLERSVLDYAQAMTATPVEVSEELFSELRKQLSEAQLVELTAAIAWENLRARFYHAFDVPAHGFSEGAYCPLPERPSTEGTHEP